MSTERAKSSLRQYIADCEAGQYIVGRDLSMMLTRLKADFDDPRYRYDSSDAEKRIAFIENECKHFEAPWAGKRFELLAWEKALIDAVYSFKIYDETSGRWVRRFSEVLLLCGRKNGKTPLLAAISLSEFYCGEFGTKIMCASNDYEQASLIFDAINAMREESPRLARVSRKNIRGIYMGNQYQKNRRGKFSYQNKGSIRKLSSRTGAKEGRNLKVVIADEVHEMRDAGLIEPLRQSLSTQDEPLFFEITTEGMVQDGYLDQRLTEARKVLSGEVENPRWLIWLYTQDSEEEIWQDETSWMKSNPSLGTVKKLTYLREKIEEAKRVPSSRAFILAKDFNLKQNAAVAWLTYDQIYNDERFTIDDLAGCPCIGGCDFAETTDLCAATAAFWLPDFSVRVYPYFWIPEAKADVYLDDGTKNALNPERRDYRRWANEGFVTIVPGAEVIVSEVADWFYLLYEKFRIMPFRVGYDNRFALEFRRRFEYLCGEGIAENVAQTTISLSEPMRALEADLTAKRVHHNDHPILTWNLGNMSVETDRNGYIKPRKNFGNAKNRIDGGAALLNAYAMYQRNRSEYSELVKFATVGR